ncbi:Maf family nucleotide pyrophosphatase [Ostreiculturibacter nitratireducens]|uniref:Maf family nucleotide pyrophosphatase n=1 Tax=Ostreiculturibacter nitratireducens TaxID=3075226 RepID=UPI0031B5718D
MTSRLILASASEIRATLLRNAGLDVETRPARIDEEAIRAALEAEGASPRDLADALAEMKARKIAEKHPGVLVLGCDQVLDFGGRVFSKPETPDDAKAQLRELSGKTHRLLSAAVVFRDGAPLWRHVGTARLTMHDLSETYIEDYVSRNWDSIRHSVGCYKLEEEGVRLFARIEGDHFTILGLPLMEFLGWLAMRGEIAR